MTRPVSIVIPAAKDLDLFEQHLPALMNAFGRRSGDEIVIVDDTGEDVLRQWFVKEYPMVRGVVHKRQRGLGKSLLSGIRRAKHDLVFCMSPEILVRDGALQPLVEAMEDNDVFAVSPRVIADEASAPMVGALRLEQGLLRTTGHDPNHSGRHFDLPVACVSRAAFMARRKDLLESCELDELFAPFQIEPLDLCLKAWRNGQRVVEVASSTVEHLPRQAAEESEPIRAAIEKNRLLALWKHLDDSELGRNHVAALRDRMEAARGEGWGREVNWLVIALAQLGELASRKASGAWPIATGASVLCHALSETSLCACESPAEVS